MSNELMRQLYTQLFEESDSDLSFSQWLRHYKISLEAVDEE